MKVFDLCLYFLLFETELSRLSFFKDFTSLIEILNYFDFFIYILLCCQICLKKFSIRNWLIGGIIGVIFILGFFSSGKTAFIKAFFLVLAIKDKPIDRVLNIYINTLIVTVSFAVVSFCLGISKETVDFSNGLSLGYGNPNQLGQVIMLLVFLLFAKTNHTLYDKQFIVIIFVGIITFIVTKSRGSALCIIFLPFFVKFYRAALKKQHSFIIPKLTSFLPALLCFFIYYSATHYEQSPYLLFFDYALSGRLFQNYHAFSQYGLNLFGQNLNLRSNEGITNTITNQWFAYLTIDNTYMMGLLLMGVIPIAIVLVIFSVCIKKAWREHNEYVIAIATLLSFYALIESQMLGIDRFFIFFYLLTNNIVRNKYIDKKQVVDKFLT